MSVQILINISILNNLYPIIKIYIFNKKYLMYFFSALITFNGN